MSTTVDSIRRVKTGENVVFELIKKKIIEANPESENIKWDDFDIYITAQLTEDQCLLAALVLKEDAKKRYEFSPIIQQNQLGIAKFKISLVSLDSLLYDELGIRSRLPYYELYSLYREISQPKYGFTVENTTPEYYEPDVVTSFTITPKPEHDDSENIFQGIYGDGIDFLIDGMAVTFYNVQSYPSVALFTDGTSTISLSGRVPTNSVPAMENTLLQVNYEDIKVNQ